MMYVEIKIFSFTDSAHKSGEPSFSGLVFSQLKERQQLLDPVYSLV